MESFLSRVLTALTWLFVPIFLTLLVGGIVLGVRESRGAVERKRVNVWASRAGVVVFSYMVATIGTWSLLKHVTERAWRSMLAQHPSRLILKTPGGRESVEINDRDEITRLLTVMVNAKRISAHHSHAIPEVTLSFPEFGRAGELDRDSEGPHEFWGPLGQFRSQELDEWLKAHWVAHP
jgi:hypothetical protein